MKREIGSDFWSMPVAEHQNKFAVSGVPHDWVYSYYISGRSAIYAAAKQVKKQSGTVLMPYYTCETISAAFLKAGFSLLRYPVLKDLSCDIGVYSNMLVAYQPDIAFVQGYFGFHGNEFKTLSEVTHQSGAILIEDLTHSLFSETERTDADYYIGSLRKFFGIPDGGFVITPKALPARAREVGCVIDQVAKTAFQMKAAYISDMQNNQKQAFLDRYSKLKRLIADFDEDFCISNVAEEQLCILDKCYLIKKRRENFNRLHHGLTGVSWLEPVHTELLMNETPLYYPVYVPADQRREIQQFFSAHQIYLPVIWPKDQTLEIEDAVGNEIYNTILCFPCDQRYDIEDMDRIIRVANDFRSSNK